MLDAQSAVLLDGGNDLLRVAVQWRLRLWPGVLDGGMKLRYHWR